MSKSKSEKFNIPSPLDSINKVESNSKYKFGDISSNIRDIIKLKPIFAFDYISLSRGKFCFDSDLIEGRKDYVDLLSSLKAISGVTYEDMKQGKRYHFHEVDYEDVTFSQADVLKCIVSDTKKVNPDNSPTIYQFKVFEEARVFGFIYKSVFYLVLFDRAHNAYKRK